MNKELKKQLERLGFVKKEFPIMEITEYKKTLQYGSLIYMVSENTRTGRITISETNKTYPSRAELITKLKSL